MKQIEAQDFLFYYNPNLEELIVSSGLKFTNRLNDGFKVDLNPHGQSVLTTVDFIDLDVDKRSLTCNVGQESALITIHTDFQVNMLGFKLVMGAEKNVLSTKRPRQNRFIFYRRQVGTSLYKQGERLQYH